MPLVVNGERIEDSVILDEERSIRPRLFEAMQNEPREVVERKVKDWARENVVERVVLRQTALADPEPVPPESVWHQRPWSRLPRITAFPRPCGRRP